MIPLGDSYLSRTCVTCGRPYAIDVDEYRGPIAAREGWRCSRCRGRTSHAFVRWLQRIFRRTAPAPARRWIEHRNPEGRVELLERALEPGDNDHTPAHHPRRPRWLDRRRTERF